MGLVLFPHPCIKESQFGEDDGTVKSIDTDQIYFLAEVNHITRKTFDKSLANIAPCSYAKSIGSDQEDASSVRLHPTHGFMWEKETLDA